MPDQIKITILEDGTITTETDAISGPNHQSADDFLATLEEYTGTKTGEKHKDGHAKHTHSHGGLIYSH